MGAVEDAASRALRSDGAPTGNICTAVKVCARSPPSLVPLLLEREDVDRPVLTLFSRCFRSVAFIRPVWPKWGKMVSCMPECFIHSGSFVFFNKLRRLIYEYRYACVRDAMPINCELSVATAVLRASPRCCLCRLGNFSPDPPRMCGFAPA